MRNEPDTAAVRPYADYLDDGLVQLSFTLPVANAPAGRMAALRLAEAMNLTAPEVVHQQALADDFTYFVLYGRCLHTVDHAAIERETFERAYMSEAEVEAYAAEHVGRAIVVVGASTGTDTHSVGIDAMLNLKGFDGSHGLEAYAAFETHNLGSQVSNGDLVATALDVGADVILVSQTVTQQNLHIHTLTELVEMIEAEGRRKEIIVVCGGPRITPELAKELGFDAGFSKGTYPHHLASYLVREVAARTPATVRS
jgi:beta-lysine 5,6-aminomutase beta subunit